MHIASSLVTETGPSALDTVAERARRSPPRKRPHSYYRLRVREDGRCAVRAVMQARSGSGTTIGTDSSVTALEAIRDARIGAVDAIVRRMDDSAEFGDIVRASFPDENYNTFDEWLDAQMTYDVNEGISNLWQGGGQWILYGLGLFYSLQIYVHALDGRTNTFAGATAQSGTEVVDARGQSDNTHGSETEGAHNTVHLASIREGDFGLPYHYDVLIDEPRLGSVRCHPWQPPNSRDTHSHSRKSPPWFGWAVIYMLVFALFVRPGAELLLPAMQKSLRGAIAEIAPTVPRDELILIRSASETHFSVI